MSIHSNVTEQDLNKLHKLAEQQKNQRAPKIENRILKQTHDTKLAESLSPITKRLDNVKGSSEKIGDVIKESQPKTAQLAIENTPQPAIENTPAPQPIENNEGRVYDVELENTLKNMTTNTGFFKTYYDSERGWMWNCHPVEMIRGTEVEINGKKFNITPNLQKVLTETSIIALKKTKWSRMGIILGTLGFQNYKP